jgi:diadenosine tetraphosphate (Ap4A) HIT family hydrolase
MTAQGATMADMGTCKLCEWERAGVPGGWFLQNKHWSVGVYPTLQVPGWVVIQLRRHATGLVDMTDDELFSMGPTLAGVARVINAETDAERVYFVSFGEIDRHVHILLIPRGPTIPLEHRASALHANSKHYSDPAAAADVAARIRATLRSGNRLCQAESAACSPITSQLRCGPEST